jgi:hypothetical protein
MRLVQPTIDFARIDMTCYGYQNIVEPVATGIETKCFGGSHA